MADRRDQHPSKRQPVVCRNRNGLGRSARAVERAVEPVSASVAREHAARSIGAVRRGGEADDEPVGAWVAEIGDRAAPIAPIRKLRFSVAGHLLSPSHQAGASRTGDDRIFQLKLSNPDASIRDLGAVVLQDDEASLLARKFGKRAKLGAPVSGIPVFGTDFAIDDFHMVGPML